MTDVRATLDHCVKCTICESHCPFSAATPLFPGPKYAGPQSERFRGSGPSPDASVDYCSSCGICTQVCPQGVKIAEINSQARAALKEAHGIPLRDRLIARPSVTGRLAVPLAPLANLSFRTPPVRAAMERATGIHRDAPLPPVARQTFQRWARKHNAPAATRSVVYFHGCSTNYYEPQTGRTAVALLEHVGYRVIVPPQDCCGLPLQSNGIFPDARRYALRLARSLAPYARAGLDIVATSTSCSLMLKREAREILGLEDDDDLRVVSERTYDICEWLRDRLDEGTLPTDFRPLPIRVPYHAPCQQRGHAIGKPALDLLALIPELEVDELDTDCCGVAGTYGLKREKYEIAMRVGERLFRLVRESGSELAVCDSETCRWQITHGSGIAAVHPITLLARAYGLDGR